MNVLTFDEYLRQFDPTLRFRRILYKVREGSVGSDYWIKRRAKIFRHFPAPLNHLLDIYRKGSFVNFVLEAKQEDRLLYFFSRRNTRDEAVAQFLEDDAVKNLRGYDSVGGCTIIRGDGIVSSWGGQEFCKFYNFGSRYEFIKMHPELFRDEVLKEIEKKK